MMCAIDSSCSMTPEIVPPRNFASNIVTIGLGLLATWMNLGLFEQVQATRVVAEYALSISRMGGVDTSELDANFEALFKKINAWIKVENRGARATFELKIINGRTETIARLSEEKLNKTSNVRLLRISKGIRVRW